MSDLSPRLDQQCQFLIEIDKLKTIMRATILTDASRNENSAEHSWHLALAALVLTEHAENPIDQLKVLKMVLIHDIVEIDAGDTFFIHNNPEQAAKEALAAQRIFSMLPADQAQELIDLWHEFEKGESQEARFAKALDRLQPTLLHEATDCVAWQEHDLHEEQVLKRMREVRDHTPKLWPRVKRLIESAIAKGRLRTHIPRLSPLANDREL